MRLRNYVLPMFIACGYAAQVNAVDIVINGSFETGDFTGWGTKDMATPFYSLGVRSAGTSPGFGLFTTSPTDGSRVASHGFDGAGPDTVEIFQDVTIPANYSADLTFDLRAGWDFRLGSPGTVRTLDVAIEPSGGGAPLLTTNVLTADASVNLTLLDTGSLSKSIDLSSYAGTSIRINFLSNIPDNFSGPGHLQIDNVVLDIQPLDADGDGVFDVADQCPDTVIPETPPTNGLGVNRFVLQDNDSSFDTTAPYGGGVGPKKSFSLEDTAGCSCEQIITIQGLGKGHNKHGCSISAMEDWISMVNP